MSKRNYEAVNDAAVERQVCKIEEYNNNNNDEIVFTDVVEGCSDVQICHPDNDAMLTVFKRVKSKQQTQSWESEFVYNMKHGNHTVVFCDSPESTLEELLMFSKNKLNLNNYLDHFFPSLHNKIVVEKTPKQVMYHMGMQVKGGKLSYYFFDTVYVKRCVSKYGEFFSLRWANMSLHNEIIAKIIIKYYKLNELIKLQDSVIIKVPKDQQAEEKNNFVKMFYQIERKNNEEVFEKGIGASRKQLECQMFSVDKFNDLFDFRCENGETKPSNEIKMYMYAIIDGFKVSKNEIEMESLENMKINEKKYSLAITPIVYFKVD